MLQNKERVDHEARHWETNRLKNMNQLEAMKEEVIHHQQELKETIQRCSELFPRIPVQSCSEKLEEEVRHLMARVKEAQKVHGNSDDILEELKQKQETYIRSREEFEELSNFSETLDSLLDNRIATFGLMKSYMTQGAITKFNELMSRRKYDGKLLIDHQQRTLNLEVNPEILAKKGQARDAKTLSGGEKSFSTICLLLALWRFMASPFRALDEFDVFMVFSKYLMYCRMR